MAMVLLVDTLLVGLSLMQASRSGRSSSSLKLGFELISGIIVRTSSWSLAYSAGLCSKCHSPIEIVGAVVSVPAGRKLIAHQRTMQVFNTRKKQGTTLHYELLVSQLLRVSR